MKSCAEILETFRSHKTILAQKFHVRRIGLFGSHVRNEAKPDSDVDALVELNPPTFDAYMDLKFYLEDLLDAPVDLVLADSVKPRLKPYIDQEVIYA